MRSFLKCVFVLPMLAAVLCAQQSVQPANAQQRSQQTQQTVTPATAASLQGSAQTSAQNQTTAPGQTTAQNNNSMDTPKQYTVPAGTQLLLRLQAPINTKTAQAGNGVYLQTIFPVTVGNTVVIPVGSFVQGTIEKVVRPGRVKGRAQVQMHFTTLILPSGYTMSLPGSLDDIQGADGVHKKGTEGTLEHDGQAGKDAGTVAEGAGAGTLATIGSLNAKAIGIGAGAGAAAGLLYTLFSRGSDIRIESGTEVEMVLQRPLVLGERKVDEANSKPTQLVPVNTMHVLEKDHPVGIAPAPCGLPVCY